MKRLILLVSLLAACDDELQPEVTGPLVLVEKLTNASTNTWSPCGGLAAPTGWLAADTTLTERAAENAPCQLVAGGDELRVVVQYEGLAFERPSSVTMPTVQVVADGEVVQTLATTRLLPPDGSAREFAAVARLVAPDRVSRVLRLRVDGGEGFVGELDGDIALVAPKPTLTVKPCHAPEGTFQAATGSACVDLASAPAGLAKSATIVARAPDGTRTTETVSLVADDSDGDKVLTLRTATELRFPVPEVAGTWTFDGTIGAFAFPARSVSVSAAALTVTPSSTDATLRVGERLDLEVEAPEYWRPTEVQLRTFLSGVELASQTQTFKADRRARWTLTAPERPGEDWSFVVRSGPWETKIDARRLLARGAPDIAVVKADDPADGVDFSQPDVARALREKAACAQVLVVAHFPHVPDRSIRRLRTSAGTFSPGSTVQDVEIVGGRGSATLHLPQAGADRELIITALEGEVVRASTTYRLGEVHPVAMTRFVAPPEVRVSSTGSAPALVRGALSAPDGVKFPPGTKVVVTLVANRDVEAEEDLSCGAPMPPWDVDCGPVGACVLAPRQVEVDPDGQFTIPLAAGVCFAGTVTVRVEGRRVDDSAPHSCIADLTPSATELLDEATIPFVPIVASDGGSPDGGSSNGGSPDGGN